MKTSKLKKKKKKKKKEEKKKEEQKDVGYIKGKEHEDLLFPEKSGQQKKKKKQPKKKKATGKITHTWDTFTRFEEFQLGEAPITVSQIPAALEKVKQKLGEFQTKSVQEKTRILKEIEEEEKKDRELELENKKIT